MTNRLFIFYYLRAKKEKKSETWSQKKKKNHTNNRRPELRFFRWNYSLLNHVSVQQNEKESNFTRFPERSSGIIIISSLRCGQWTDSRTGTVRFREAVEPRLWTWTGTKRSRAAAEPTWVPVNAVSSFFLKLCKEEVCCRCRESGLGRALTPTLQTPEEKHTLWAFSDFRNGPVVTG